MIERKRAEEALRLARPSGVRGVKALEKDTGGLSRKIRVCIAPDSRRRLRELTWNQGWLVRYQKYGRNRQEYLEFTAPNRMAMP